MKNISKVGWLFLILIMLTQVSCIPTAFIERENEQIVGTWSFDRVRIEKLFKLDNITNEYRNAQIIFKKDNTVIYTKANGNKLEGKWRYNFINGAENMIGQLVLQLKNTANGEEFLFLWDNFGVNSRRMWGQEDYEKDGQITYRLKRA